MKSTKTSAHIRRAICAALAGMALFAHSSTPASAAIVGSRTLVNLQSFMALDVSGGSTAKFAKVIQWWPTGSTNQLWAFDLQPDNASGTSIYRLQNVNSRMCLTTDGVAAHQLYQYACQDNEPLQQWKTAISANWADTSRQFVLQNAKSGLCLDVNNSSSAPGAAVITWYCKASNRENQLWV